MTARIAGFVSRADAGLRRPDSVSRSITPSRGGVGVHYGGPAQRLTGHDVCVRRWKQWQDFHMASPRNWSDIAYTGAFCDHGYAFAGRGAGVRTAANGTNEGNQNNYGVVWLGGDGETPTQLALDALEWWVTELRRSGGAGRRVRPHRSFKPTGCPGDPLVRAAAALDNSVTGGITGAPVPPPAHVPAPRPSGDDEMDRMPVLRLGATGLFVRMLQGLLVAHSRLIPVDADFGPRTEAALREWQGAADAPGGADGVCGPGTWGRFLGLR